MKAYLKGPACQQAATGVCLNAGWPAAGRGETVDGLLRLVLLSSALTAGSLPPKSETELIPDALGRISVYPDKGKVSNFCRG